MITVIGTVAAVNTLFTHTFPSVTVPGVQPLVTIGSCGATLAASAPASASGFVEFGCVSNGAIVSAFTTGAVGVAVSVAGGIPAGYADLIVVPCSNLSCPSASTCAGSVGGLVGGVALLSTNPTPSTTGLTITATAGAGLAANTGYAYCADVSNTSTSPLTIPTFTATWQQ
jgi:hypothetical protein